MLQFFDLGVKGFLDFLRRVAGRRLAAHVKKTSPLHRVLRRADIVRDAAAEDEALVKPAGVRGQKLAENFKRVGIFVAEWNGVIKNFHLRIGVHLGVHALLNGLLRLQRDEIGRIICAAWDAAKIFFQLGD